MKLVIQRVSSASVDIDGREVGSIGIGLVVFVGLEQGDAVGHVDRAAKKVASLRVFEDESGKMNRSLNEVNGEVLAVSQFTIAGSIRRGRRPSFDKALPGPIAEPLFDQFVDHLRAEEISVATGVFGAYMDVKTINSGPVTLLWSDP
ncbi:MAG: D-tyrosyl-tRNA(Tyr) deacylase [bacterium]|nr:D-tyrosyl-tRNA(Tyr) deacylase [bacterium]